ncbi:MAG TPA: hypothetical protein VGV90_05140 [Solirubrobacteraceae bacterium]|nr:hypothetical protein [Solirubrobacteraceae bacterium]
MSTPRSRAERAASQASQLNGSKEIQNYRHRLMIASANLVSAESEQPTSFAAQLEEARILAVIATP